MEYLTVGQFKSVYNIQKFVKGNKFCQTKPDGACIECMCKTYFRNIKQAFSLLPAYKETITSWISSFLIGSKADRINYRFCMGIYESNKGRFIMWNILYDNDFQLSSILD